MKQTLIFISCLITQVLFSQQYGNRIYSYNLENISYYKYENLNVYVSLKNISNVTNETPEKLAESIFSCSSKEWDIKNTLGGESNIETKTKEEYLQITKVDKTKNYLELINKFEFSIDNVPTAIIKFYFVSDTFPKPQAGIFVMQKISNIWYKINTKMVNNIALSNLKLKPNVLDKILNNIFDTNELKEIKNKILVQNTIDFNKLTIEIDSWDLRDDTRNKQMRDFFKDPNSIL